MSRIGKKAVAVPSGVTAGVEGQTVKVKGPKGALELVLHDDVAARVEDGAIKIDPRADTRRLEISGVGYRAAVQGKNLQLSLGYSHEVLYPIPDGIAIATPRPIEIVVTGIDKQKVGQVAAEIRRFRPPEPYKGKGVRFAGEYIFRKEGKKK